MATIPNERSNQGMQDEGAGREARGAAGTTAGAHADVGPEDAQAAGGREPQGDLEERRETQQVLRPSSDGIGEGMVKDAG